MLTVIMDDQQPGNDGLINHLSSVKEVFHLMKVSVYGHEPIIREIHS